MIPCRTDYKSGKLYRLQVRQIVSNPTKLPRSVNLLFIKRMSLNAVAKRLCWLLKLFCRVLTAVLSLLSTKANRLSSFLMKSLNVPKRESKRLSSSDAWRVLLDACTANLAVEQKKPLYDVEAAVYTIDVDAVDAAISITSSILPNLVSSLPPSMLMPKHRTIAKTAI